MMSELALGNILETDDNWKIRALYFERPALEIPTGVRLIVESHNTDGVIAPPIPPSIYDAKHYIYDPQTVLETINQAGINLREKYFIITHIVGIGVTYPSFRNFENQKYGRPTFTQAAECTEKGQLIEDGLTIHFKKNGPHGHGLPNPKVVGCYTIDFGRRIIHL